MARAEKVGREQKAGCERVRGAGQVPVVRVRVREGTEESNKVVIGSKLVMGRWRNVLLGTLATPQRKAT